MHLTNYAINKHSAAYIHNNNLREGTLDEGDNYNNDYEKLNDESTGSTK